MGMPAKKKVVAVKPRKTTDGPLKNKARTIQVLLDAVGRIIKTEGHHGLNIKNIADTANVSRKLIYVYFGGLNKLVETYVLSNEYWHVPGNEDIAKFLAKGDDFGKDDIFIILKNQFRSLHTSVELQKIVLWEISERNDVLRKLADGREKIGEVLLKVTDKQFQQTGLDIRAVLALLIGGIYYLNLHAAVNGSTFCGIDINKPKGNERVLNSLKTVVDLCYQKSNTKPAKKANQKV